MGLADLELNHRIREGLKRWTASASLSGGARAKLLLRASAAQHRHRAHHSIFEADAPPLVVESLGLADHQFLVYSLQSAFRILGILR
jgi:hypothetical protein